MIKCLLKESFRERIDLSMHQYLQSFPPASMITVTACCDLAHRRSSMEIINSPSLLPRVSDVSRQNAIGAWQTILKTGWRQCRSSTPLSNEPNAMGPTDIKRWKRGGWGALLHYEHEAFLCLSRVVKILLFVHII